MLSIFDIYKVGVGPSSSHTNGPMIAGFAFSQKIEPFSNRITKIKIDLYGSLSLTGKGHHTDKATVLGLMGNKPNTMNIEEANAKYHHAIKDNLLFLSDINTIDFNFNHDIIFHLESLPFHENGMSISAFDSEGELIEKETYYSVGGGFVATEDELKNGPDKPLIQLEFPFFSAEDLLRQAEVNNCSLGDLILKNELAFHDQENIDALASQIWRVMSACIDKGLQTEGILEGGLNVSRRAPALLKSLKGNTSNHDDPMEVLDWINAYAFAVSEENAAGGQVITSPTNGAAGVVPAVLMYYNSFIKTLDLNKIKHFLAVSGAIGMLYKTNASISGAEVGCQGEIGVSSSMAAAGLTALRGGSNEQICIAAEIAMEHSLGMTCDPIGGLVQVPCIERNAMGSIKAINASRMALKRTGECMITLDKVIATMYQTGKDMNKIYRETSLGGLAIIHLAPPCE